MRTVKDIDKELKSISKRLNNAINKQQDTLANSIRARADKLLDLRNDIEAGRVPAGGPGNSVPELGNA